MNFLLASVFLLLFSGLTAVAAHRRATLATLIGAGGTVVACVVGLLPSLSVLATGATLTVKRSWSMPMGSFYIQVDPLTALFLLPILVLAALAAIYGAQYLKKEKDQGGIGAHWFFFNLLVAGMIMVVMARNGLLFLIAWEVMSVAPFFLVIFEDRKSSARNAAWTYLVAAHLGGMCLVVLFLWMGAVSGSLDFHRLAVSTTGSTASGMFVLAVIGFGAKAGFMPLHVWLPEAHPAAPSHVSALMSGVMIKMGIYGLLRILTLLGPPMAWWGYLMIGIGLSSGILGVLFALAQHDLKRLLAYHSVENIGIIALGIGAGMVGLAIYAPSLAVLGFAGAMLHVINHAVFKGLLFLGAGAVLHGTHSMEIDHLGGLIKRMPWTGALFLIGAVAICGLPPLNGFISEFLIYLGSLGGITTLAAVPAGALLALVAGLALIGGLAAACFTKAFGVVFLGTPRSPAARDAREAGMAMRFSMLTLAVACAVIGLGAPWIVPALGPAVHSATGLSIAMVHAGLHLPVMPLTGIVYGALVLAGLVIVLIVGRRMLMASRTVHRTTTWGCGYSAPSARMQYTASSFAQPLTDLSRFFLRPHCRQNGPDGIFPDHAVFSSHTPDVYQRYFYMPLFGGVARLLAGLQWLQHGRIQLYILYIVVALFTVFVWKLM